MVLIPLNPLSIELVNGLISLALSSSAGLTNDITLETEQEENLY